jgi:hypothetical protein
VTLTLAETVLRHELAHAVMTVWVNPRAKGLVTVKVAVSLGRDPFGCAQYPTRLDISSQDRARIALAGPAYCEEIGAAQIGAGADLRNALQLLGSVAAVRAMLPEVRRIVARVDFREAVESRAAALLRQGEDSCLLNFTV